MTVDKLLAFLLEAKASGRVSGRSKIHFEDDQYYHDVIGAERDDDSPSIILFGHGAR